MSNWTGVLYREFYDVPRAIIARRGGETHFFNSRFDESVDEYIDHYEVWRLPSVTDHQLAGSWIGLELLAIERLADVGLRELPFDMAVKVEVVACKAVPK